MSFSSTTPKGKKSTHNVEPFMTAGPEYRRNWLGTIFTALVGLNVIPDTLFRILGLTYSVQYGNWHSGHFYLQLAILILVLILKLAILVIFYKALTNPRFLHGVDSADNLKPYKYYIFFFLGIFVLNLVIAIWRKVQEEDASGSGFVVPTAALSYVLIDILIYWAWGHKCDAHAVPARIFMPFLPKV